MAAARKLLSNGLARSTRLTYVAAWSKYRQFALLHGYPAVPVTFELLANWITEQSRLSKPESLRQYLAGIHSYLIKQGLSTAALDDPRIPRILKGALRIHGI